MSYADWGGGGTTAGGAIRSPSQPDYASGTSALSYPAQRETRADQSKDIDDFWDLYSRNVERSTSAFHSRYRKALPKNASETPISDTHSREATRTAIHELRRLSGLTWDQLAQLFGVDRRSLHHWASGQPLSRKNEERLNRLLAVIRHIDRGAADLNRQALLAPTANNIHPFDLLARGDYDKVKEILGRGPGRQEIRRKPLSPEARVARYPVFTPEELVDARHEPVHIERKGSRVPRVTRSKKTR